jgi:cytosine/adenosine deaminase-related metal-dependent hydrolase
MVTIDAARAIGRDADLGSLEIGKRADVVLLDLWKAHLQPINMLVDQIVAKAMGSDVDTVVCDGRLVLERGRATQVDENAILERAIAEAGLMRERAGLEPLLGHAAGFWDCSRY